MSSRRALLLPLLIAIGWSVRLFGQDAPATSVSSASSAGAASASPATPESSAATPISAVAREFPVIMQQNVVAGKTPIGTKIQAKLELATLAEGKVIPRNAVFSGEVVESAPKTATDASRLSIRMDSVQWKNGSTPIKAYLTAWYYPTTTDEGQNLQYGPTQSQKATWNGQGAYPDPNSRSYKPFPGSETDKDSSVPDTPSSATSHHRVAMKDVESAQSNEGAITLASKRSNIKLDKLTTYILSTGDPIQAR
jgi:hypothetical protein